MKEFEYILLHLLCMHGYQTSSTSETYAAATKIDTYLLDLEDDLRHKKLWLLDPNAYWDPFRVVCDLPIVRSDKKVVIILDINRQSRSAT